MAKSGVSDTLIDQFGKTWTMWREELGNFPEEQWSTGDVNYLLPGRHAWHVIECCDYYMASVPPSEFQWGIRFGGDWEEATPEQLPARQQILTAMDDVQAKLEAWLSALADQGLQAPETVCHWTGTCILGRALYLLRHNQHHLGEIHAELRRRDLPRAKWK